MKVYTEFSIEFFKNVLYLTDRRYVYFLDFKSLVNKYFNHFVFLFNPLTTTGYWCPKPRLQETLPHDVVYHDIDMPKTIVFYRQEVSLSNKVETKV